MSQSEAPTPILVAIHPGPPDQHSQNARAWWTASFTVDGGDPVTIPGTVAGPAGQAAIVVKQARGVLVQNPGGH